MERTGRGDILKIRISGLSNGLHEYHFSAVPSEIGLESNFAHDVKVDVVVDKTPRQVYLKSDIRTAGRFTCDRCIESFERPLDAHFSMFYIFDELDRGNHIDDEITVLSPDTVSIDVAEEVRQVITISVPLKLLCKEECKGLCPRCGKNRNIEQCDCRDDEVDSRWQGLAGLINN